MTRLLEHAISRAKTLSNADQDRLASLMLAEIATSRPQTDPGAPPETVWDIVQRAFADVPEEEWAKIPTDGASQHDHYLYGTPKRPS
jgi:hypothetical protein